ncbi:MAG: GyrI-like domain-containing protein [Desulfosarcinaceae bacterium]|nr:GyrI-like domain-containing protein [Desulfosarcinaceae bacterium]
MDPRSIKPQTVVDYRKRVCRAMNYISRHLARELSLDEIAAEAAFSQFHFHRIFKAVVGETVAAFTRRLRLEMAAGRLLARPTEEITTIAMACGFSSSQNFAKSFRSQFGTTPTDFRNRKLGNKARKWADALSLSGRYTPDTAFITSQTEERSSTMQAAVREMPAYPVAYVRKMGPYGPETSAAAFAELIRWAGPRGYLESGVMLGVCWDNPEITPPAKCRLDACISLPADADLNGPVGRQTIDGGPYAVCYFETAANGFKSAWEAAFTWLVNSGYECADRPCYERYHNHADDHPDGMWQVDICIPLKVSAERLGDPSTKAS